MTRDENAQDLWDKEAERMIMIDIERYNEENMQDSEVSAEDIN